MILKLKYLTLCFIFFLVVPKIQIANSAYIKYANNPILIPDQIYDSGGISVSTTLKKDGKFYLYYGGGTSPAKSISLAISTDGLSWTKYTGNPLIKHNPSNPYICEKGVSDPYVLFDSEESLFKMWFTANCEPQSTGVPRYWIKYATSSDGFVWDVRTQPVISSSFLWDNEIVAQPTVIKEAGIYKLWFGARSSVTGNTIGFATSSDGINWVKNPNPAITATKNWEYTGVGGPEIEKINNKYILFYHGSLIEPKTIGFAISDDAQTWTKSDNPIFTIDAIEAVLNSPDVIRHNNNTYIYYGARISGTWKISLATEFPISSSPSSTPLIYLPGMFGSWSEEGLLHGQATTYKDWVINPIVHEYDGIKQTLINLGLKENEDFYFFPYDWRKPVKSSSDDLKEFIDKNFEPGAKISLAGHSQGGLISRVFAQRYKNYQIDKLVTVGSPHTGSAYAYKVVEGDTHDHAQGFEWLAEKILLKINKKKFETDKQTLANVAPIFKDLLPIYPYLQTDKGDFIEIASMTEKNNTLLELAPDFYTINPFLSTIAGSKFSNTDYGYRVKNRTIMDTLLDLYPDGRPTANLHAPGDGRIIVQSASQGSQKRILPDYGHAEIVYKSEGISNLLDLLEIAHTPSDITEGEKTKIFPSIIFLIKSPAFMTLYHNGSTYNQQDGMIFVENAPEGPYNLSVTGLEKGHYTVHMGQIFEDKDIWKTIEADITQDPPTSQVDTYRLYFDYQNSDSLIAKDDQLFNDLISTLKNIYENYQNIHLFHAITSAEKAKESFLSDSSHQLKSQLMSVHRNIFHILKNCPSDKALSLTNTVQKLESLYPRVINLQIHSQEKNMLARLSRYEVRMANLQDELLEAKINGEDVIVPALYLQYAYDRIEPAREAINNQNLHYADILLESVNDLLHLAGQI